MEPVPPAEVSVAALSVVYHNAISALVESARAFDNAARLGREADLCTDFILAWGDASESPILTGEQLDEIRAACPSLTILYEFFDENTGTSRGQNRLSALTASDLIVLCNPDVIPDGRAVWRLAAMFEKPGLGLAEARQVPVEHPKDYDVGSGATSWGSGAFSMVPRAVFEEVGGFDADTFFLYCDDVDLSWRIREAGYRVATQPAAVVFHDKSLSGDGAWVPTDAERYYSAEAALLLNHKWSQDHRVAELLEAFAGSEDANLLKAAAEFRRRRRTNGLPPQRDGDHVVARFVDGNYAVHRYAL